ncbi:ribosomal large subunit pseudouridine synthase B [Acidovorax sp. 107]|uniref:pseudouridine synthase n=1 Tax=Acidovorax sp. 107 TaxID=2135638 RepID=UPI000D35A266|nr:pseudouridine synthase [Acidovorax sp. 107]PUA99690.1 ribosomal large subunit pseudouridine synthase B [Acidovorax sp. 107]
MNDSTPENPAELPGLNAADAVPAAKKPAAKRAPRKKAAPGAVEAAGLEAAAVEPVAISGPASDAPVAEAPAQEVRAAVVEIGSTALVSAAEGEGGPLSQERSLRDEVRRRSPHPEGAGRDKRKAAAVVEGYQFEDVVSGRFDEEDASTDAVPPKRVLLPQVETPKLHKVLAQAGLGSRLEMEQLILEGRISVNNEPAHIGQRIQFGDQVKVNGKPIRYRIDPPPARVIAYHKPVGEVVTHDDPQNRPTVFRKLPRLMQGKWQSVGRLDLNTEGLLLFTSSGELANKLMHPRFGLEREYAVRVLGALSNEEKQKLLDGVRLDDGMASFGSIEDGGGEGSNCWYRVTISEGRNREVRRMLESVGHAVSRLIRIRYGAMVLPRGLKRGAWLELDESDIRALVQAAGAGRPAPVEGRSEGGDAGGRSGKPRNRGRGGPRGDGARRDMSQPPVPGGPRGQKPRRDGGQSAARGNNSAAGGDRQRGGAAQPDPMKTSVGYIGMDSLSRHRQDKRRPGGGGPRRGGGGR